MGTYIEALDQQLAALGDELMATLKANPANWALGRASRRWATGCDHHHPDGRAEKLRVRTPLLCLAWVDIDGTFCRRKAVTGQNQQAGNERLRQLLFVGTMSVIRLAKSGDKSASPWFLRLRERKPCELVAVALANRMAKIIWPMTSRSEAYRPQLVVA